MVNKIEVYGNNALSNAISKSKDAHERLEDSYNECVSLHGFVRGSEWGGESKLAFLTYLEIVMQYHGALSSAFDAQTSALESLDNHYDDYYSNNKVKGVRNI